MSLDRRELRRRKRFELEAQLRALDEEERYGVRAAHQPPQRQPPLPHQSRTPSSPPSHLQPQWPPERRGRNNPSTAFQPVPPPQPMSIQGSSTSRIADAPQTNTLFGSPSPALPNPYSASFVNIPVPSYQQVHEYLVGPQKQPLGLQTAWAIEGKAIDVYALFTGVTRLGGSATITRREWWPGLAGLLGIPAINTPHGLRSSPAAAQQLKAFYEQRLGDLETMWDRTKSADGIRDRGGQMVASGGAMSNARGNGVSRQQLSHERHQAEGSVPITPITAVPPAQPGPTMNGSVVYTPAGSAPPLHQPTPSYQRPADLPGRLQQQAESLAGQQSSGLSNGSASGGQSHHFASSPNSQAGPSRSHAPIQTPPLPSTVASSGPIHPQQLAGSDSSTAPKPPSAQSQRNFTFPSLTNYIPPKFVSFKHLVMTKALPLPKPPPNVQLDFVGSQAEVYAKRCFELRGVVKKMQAKEVSRLVSVDEMMFWQKLLAILRHNPQVVIPGAQPMDNSNAQHLGAPIAQPVNAEAGPSTLPMSSAQAASTNGVPSDSVSINTVPADGSAPKKRGRPRKLNPDGTPAVTRPPKFNPDGTPTAKRKRISNGDGSILEVSADGLLSQSHAIPKRKKLKPNPDCTPIEKRPVGRPRKVLFDTDGNPIETPPQPKVILDPDGNPIERPPKAKKLKSVPPQSEDPTAQGTSVAAASTQGGGEPQPMTLSQALTDVSTMLEGAQAGPSSRPDASATPAADFLRMLEAEATSAGPSSQIKFRDSQQGGPKVKNPKRVKAAQASWGAWRDRLAGSDTHASIALDEAPAASSSESQQADLSSRPEAKRVTISSPSSSPVKKIKKARLSNSVISLSPKRIIDLSGGRSVQASLKDDDVITPTKVFLAQSKASNFKKNGSASQMPKPRVSFTGPDFPTSPDATANDFERDAPENIAAAMLTPITALPAMSSQNEPSAIPDKSKRRETSTDAPTRFGKRREPPSPEPDSSATRLRSSSVPRPLSAPSSEPSNGRANPLRHAPSVSSPLSIRSSKEVISHGNSSTHARSPSTPLRSPTPRPRLTPFVEIVSPVRARRASNPLRKQKPGSTRYAHSPLVVQRRPALSRPIKHRLPRPPVDRAVVVIPISRRRRNALIQKGYYDPFRDDYSDEDHVVRRHPHIPLRPKIVASKLQTARYARPRSPEMVPLRFATRPGPVLEGPLASVLDESTLTKRVCEMPCGWKGCDAVLGSEELLKKHVEFRRHAEQGGSKLGGLSRNETLYRCHWASCKGPSFSRLEGLKQHLTARHISPVLHCPWTDCELRFANVSLLARHAVRQHDNVGDLPVPLADLSPLPPPPLPDQPLPTEARTDVLTTPPVPGTAPRSAFRQQLVAAKVVENCFAGDDPIMHVEHPPHMLEAVGEEETASEDDDEEDEEAMTWEDVQALRSQDARRRIEVVVEIVRPRKDTHSLPRISEPRDQGIDAGPDQTGFGDGEDEADEEETQNLLETGITPFTPAPQDWLVSDDAEEDNEVDGDGNLENGQLEFEDEQEALHLLETGITPFTPAPQDWADEDESASDDEDDGRQAEDGDNDEDEDEDESAEEDEQETLFMLENGITPFTPAPQGWGDEPLDEEDDGQRHDSDLPHTGQVHEEEEEALNLFASGIVPLTPASLDEEIASNAEGEVAASNGDERLVDGAGDLAAASAISRKQRWRQSAYQAGRPSDHYST